MTTPVHLHHTTHDIASGILQVLIPELGAGSCHLLGAWLQDVLRPEGPADMSVRKAALGLVSSVLHQYPLLNRYVEQG
jgi:hypothetical protein